MIHSHRATSLHRVRLSQRSRRAPPNGLPFSAEVEAEARPPFFIFFFLPFTRNRLLFRSTLTLVQSEAAATLGSMNVKTFWPLPSSASAWENFFPGGRGASHDRAPSRPPFPGGEKFSFGPVRAASSFSRHPRPDLAPGRSRLPRGERALPFSYRRAANTPSRRSPEPGCRPARCGLMFCLQQQRYLPFFPLLRAGRTDNGPLGG